MTSWDEKKEMGRENDRGERGEKILIGIMKTGRERTEGRSTKYKS